VLQSLLMLDAESGDKQAAVRRIEAALSADPGNASLLILAAQTHIAANEISKAESDLQQVIVLDPSRNEAYGLLAGLYTASGRTSEAIFELDKLSAKQPKLVGVHVLKGMLFENQRRREDAKQSYLQALTLDAHSPIAANNLAWLYAEGNEKLDEALELARNAKSQRPDSPDIADTLGWVLYKKGLFDLAIGALRDVAQAHPERGDIQYHLGLAYLKNGDTVQARDALQKALSGQLPPSQAAEVRTALKQIGG
jgi:Flp pilus assembly protein TadD